MSEFYADLSNWPAMTEYTVHQTLVLNRGGPGVHSLADTLVLPPEVDERQTETAYPAVGNPSMAVDAVGQATYTGVGLAG